jgi:hypothetical protein
MWSLVIAFLMNSTPPEFKFTNLAEVKTYKECKDLAKDLRERGLVAHMFCVEKQ